jgi:hypothetical protein
MNRGDQNILDQLHLKKLQIIDHTKRGSGLAQVPFHITQFFVKVPSKNIRIHKVKVDQNLTPTQL